MDDPHTLIKGEVDYSADTRAKYSHDASIFQVTPQAVVYPKDAADLGALIRYAAKRRDAGVDISLTPRNGGTCMSGGSLTESYMVDMSRHFNVISPVDTNARSVTVQGGVMHIKVEEATHPLGLYFPPYTSSHDICGVGGMIGNNASGEKSIKYGPTSKNIRRLKAVLADGNEYEFGPLSHAELDAKRRQPGLEGKLYREITRILDENWETIKKAFPKTKKNVAGYALNDLWDEAGETFNLGRIFVGAQGTLGFVTQAELNLVPFAPNSRMIVTPIDDLSRLAPTVQTMLRFNPDTCETFDRYTYALAKQFHPEDAARAHVAEGQRIVIFAIYSGNSQDEADTTAGAAKNALEAEGHPVMWIDDPATLESFLLIRRKSFKLLLEHPDGHSRAMPFLEDTIVPIEKYGEFLAALEVIIADYPMTYTYAGHIGDGSIRLVPLVDMEKPGAREMILEVSRRVYDLVFAFGGSMSVDHNDGLIRTPFLERMYGPQVADLFRQVKNLFDPQGLFNPRKKVGGTLEYAHEHMYHTNG